MEGAELRGLQDFGLWKQGSRDAGSHQAKLEPGCHWARLQVLRGPQSEATRICPTCCACGAAPCAKASAHTSAAPWLNTPEERTHGHEWRPPWIKRSWGPVSRTMGLCPGISARCEPVKVT